MIGEERSQFGPESSSASAATTRNPPLPAPDTVFAKLIENAWASACDPTGPDFDSILGQVVESVTHHVEEEEESVLPGLREQLSEERRAELGEKFLAARAEHLGEQPGEARKEDLEQQAENIGMTGASSMGKSELKSELEDQAEE